MIGLPVAALLAAFAHRMFAPIAAGMAVAICLLLVWLSHEFVRPQLVLDTDDRTLTIAKPYGLGTYSPIEVDEVERVSVVRSSRTALVNVSYHGRAFSKPYATAIDAGDVHDLETRFERLGIPVHVRGPAPTALTLDAVRARVIATPVVLFGSIAVTRWAFGPGALRTNVVIVPAIVLVGSATYSFW